MRIGQYQVLMTALKNLLKKRGVLYSQVADSLGLSESSVKRLMNADDGNLSRVEEICELLQISFYDLVSSCQDEKLEGFVIKGELEKFFSENTAHFYILSLVQEHGCDFESLLEYLKITPHSLRIYLKKLEELGLLEMHAGDRIKTKIRGNLEIKGLGKMQRHLMKNTLDNFTEFMVNPQIESRKSSKNGTGHYSMFDCYLTKESAEQFQKEFNELSERLKKTAQREQRLHQKSELIYHTVLKGLLPIRFYREDVPEV